LTEEELSIVRQHTYHTYSILCRCGLPQNIIEWAAFHHETLNGQGYPFHLKQNQIDSGSRIIAAADVLTALAEDRPYRKGMNRKETLSILCDMIKEGHLDPFVVEVIKKNYEDIAEPTFLKQQAAIEQYHEGAIETSADGLY
jgi:HD-GYP domain-containing protein (c-di-GMP phosphodiesterase class II)